MGDAVCAHHAIGVMSSSFAMAIDAVTREQRRRKEVGLAVIGGVARAAGEGPRALVHCGRDQLLHVIVASQRQQRISPSEASTTPSPTSWFSSFKPTERFDPGFRVLPPY